MTEQTITQFVSDWFKAMEPMPENIDWFLGRVSESLELVMPEGAFEGHAGFETWYRGAARTFEAGWVHDIQQLNVGEAVDGVYPVEMELTLIATMIAPEGKPAKQLKLPLTESWTVSVADSGDVTIHSYRVAMKR